MMLQMQHIRLCAMKKNRKQILELLQRRGMIEVEEIVSGDCVFETIDLSASCVIFEKTAREAAQALEILGESDPPIPSHQQSGQRNCRESGHVVEAECSTGSSDTMAEA